MSVQHQGPCAVSIRELWQQIEEMKATIAELKTTLRDDRVSVNEQIDTVVDELEREGRRRVSLSSRLSKQAFKVAQVQIMNEYQGIRHARFTTTEVPAFGVEDLACSLALSGRSFEAQPAGGR